MAPHYRCLHRHRLESKHLSPGLVRGAGPVRRSPTAVDPELRWVDISLEVGSVDAAYALGQTAGLEIVREIRNEAWGIRRFFVRDPAGRVINVASHLA